MKDISMNTEGWRGHDDAYAHWWRHHKLYKPVECSLVKVSHERVHGYAKNPALGIHPKERIPQNEKLYSCKCYCSIICNTKKTSNIWQEFRG